MLGSISGRWPQLELVRYIHLNPLRAQRVADMDDLGTFPFCGHGTVMGKIVRSWQDGYEIE